MPSHLQGRIWEGNRSALPRPRSLVELDLGLEGLRVFSVVTQLFFLRDPPLPCTTCTRPRSQGKHLYLVRRGIQDRVERTRSPALPPSEPIALLARYPSSLRFPCSTS